MFKLYVYATGYNKHGQITERAKVSLKEWCLWHYDRFVGEAIGFIDYYIDHNKQPKWLRSFIYNRLYWLCHDTRQGHAFDWERV